MDLQIQDLGKRGSVKVEWHDCNLGRNLHNYTGRCGLRLKNRWVIDEVLDDIRGCTCRPHAEAIALAVYSRADC